MVVLYLFLRVRVFFGFVGFLVCFVVFMVAARERTVSNTSLLLRA